MPTQRRDPVEAPARRQLLSLGTLEERSEVKAATWRLWIRQGKIEAVRLGRRVLVEEDAYNRFIDRNRGK